MLYKRPPVYECAFVFGAGASIRVLPAQRSLVDELIRVTTSPHPPDIPAKLLDQMLQARVYLDRTFPGAAGANVPFENVVGPLEISEADEYWYHYASRTRSRERLITNRDVLDGLDAWLACALDPPNIPKRPHDKDFAGFYGPSSSTLEYARLLQLLGRLDLLARSLFVSMNYDVLLDRAMLAASKCQPDYWIEAFADEPPQHECVPLLKLHGSLNWRVCGSCHILRNLRTGTIWPKSRCKDCGADSARPMLIRPTLLKNFRHRVWQEVWQQAGRHLATAKHWVFIGYSLPLADVWMLRLLAQSLRSGALGAARRITIVDPDPQVLDRYRVLFPSAIQGGQTFDEWLGRSAAAGSVK